MKKANRMWRVSPEEYRTYKKAASLLRKKRERHSGVASTVKFLDALIEKQKKVDNCPGLAQKKFSVWVYYRCKGRLDTAFDEALFLFGRLHGMGLDGTGMGMAGKFAGVRDISFSCGTWERARKFQDAVRARFKVRTKLREDVAQKRS